MHNIIYIMTSVVKFAYIPLILSTFIFILDKT